MDIFDLVTLGYIGIYIIALIINLIPFMSPSNTVLAGVFAFLLPNYNPIIIAIIVALAATTAKMIHYYTIRYSRKLMSEERQKNFDQVKEKYEKWGSFGLFIAAASPVPDDPLIVYVALTKYSAVKMTIYYFVGKLLATLLGTIIGFSAGTTITDIFGTNLSIMLSIVLTVIITGILFEMKMEKRSEESDISEESEKDQDENKEDNNEV